jgi:lipoprotein-releasing system permease protein
MQLSFFIARRYLLRQKGSFSSFIIRLAIIATSLSVAVMVLAVAFITGFKYEIRQKLFSFWGHVHIAPYSVNASNLIAPEPIQYDPNLVRGLSAIPHVVQVAPYAVRPGILQSNGVMEGVKLKGVTGSYHLSAAIPFKGSPIDFSDSSYSRQIVLSQRIADRLDIKAGGQLQLYFIEAGAAPRIRKVTVSGIFHTGMDEIDKEYAICDLRLLQHLNNWEPDDINGYQLDLDQPDLSDTIASTIIDQYAEPPLTAYTMRDIYENIFDWLQLQDVNVRILLIIMGLMAVINIAATLLILMVDRAHLIGLLKAMGMPVTGIRRIFLVMAGLICIPGILLGNLIGLGICLLQQRTGFLTLPESTYYISKVAVSIHWWQVAFIDLATLMLCVLCMWLPSLYIRRIQPARVLQFK